MPVKATDRKSNGHMPPFSWKINAGENPMAWFYEIRDSNNVVAETGKGFATHKAAIQAAETCVSGPSGVKTPEENADFMSCLKARPTKLKTFSATCEACATRSRRICVAAARGKTGRELPESSCEKWLLCFCILRRFDPLSLRLHNQFDDFAHRAISPRMRRDVVRRALHLGR